MPPASRYTQAAPATTNPTIAAILMVEKAYSTQPNTVTLNALTVIRAAENPTIQTRPGTFGSHSRM